LTTHQYRRFGISSAKGRRRGSRRMMRMAPRILSALGGAYRELRFEVVEERTLLTHAAPLMNTADLPAFAQVAENLPIASNTGSTVGAMLASGGPIVLNQPLGTNFLSLDHANGAQQGIAVTWLADGEDGAWQYFINGGTSWTAFGPNVSTSNAVVLRDFDKVRFLPNSNVTGIVSMQFDAWDQTDGAAAGGRVDLSLFGATGGGTAYSAANDMAILGITAPNVAPSFSLATASTLENNTNGGPSGGGNAAVIPVPNFATHITLGSGGANAVSFSVTDGGGNFGPLFKQAPAIDSSGTLTYQLNTNVYGTATLNVTATNGALTSAVQLTTITIVQTSPPTFNVGPNERLVENASAQTYPNWATNLVAGAPNTSGALSFAVQSDSDAGLFSAAPAISVSGATGTLTFTPAAGQYGAATIGVVLTNSGDGLTSTLQTFTITLLAPPTARVETYVLNYSGASTAGSSDSVLNDDSDPNAGGTLSAAVVSSPSYGSLGLNPNGTFTYTPNGGFRGIDRFSYQAVDSPAASGAVTDTLYSHEGALINKLYQEVLNRPVDDGTLMANAPSLHSGALSMATLAGEVIGSAEHLNAVVNALYEQFLGRGASSQDESSWGSVWSSNGGPEQVIIGVGSSPECYNHAGANNTGWVTLMYENILNRQPDSGGLNYFVGQLNAGAMTLGQVVSTLVTGGEYRGDVIANFYGLYLLRAPSSSETNYWVGQFSSGATQLSIQESIIGSAEYAGNPVVPAAGSAYRWTY